LEKLKTNDEQFRNEIEEAIQENNQKDTNNKSGVEETTHVNAQKDVGDVDDKRRDLKESQAY